MKEERNRGGNYWNVTRARNSARSKNKYMKNTKYKRTVNCPRNNKTFLH